MDLGRLFSEGAFYVSYRENFAFYFMISCIVCAASSFLLAWFLLERPVPRFVLFLRARCALDLFISRWMLVYIALLYLGGLILISPPISFLFLSSSDFLPQIFIVVPLQGLFALLGWSMQPRNELVPIVALMALWSGAFALAFLVQVPTMFDMLDSSYEIWVGIAASVPLSFAAVYSSAKLLLEEKTQSVRFIIPVIFRGPRIWMYLIATTGLGIWTTKFFAGLCMAPFASILPGPHLSSAETTPFGISTRFLRSFTSPPCRGISPRSVCHVYLTAGPDLGSTVFVNVHMAENAAEYLRVVIDDEIEIVATLFETPLIEPHYKRQVFSAFVPNLVPGKDHIITFRSQLGIVGEPVYMFKMPFEHSIRVATGGDAGVTKASKKLISNVLSRDPLPDLFVIGGDVAYDNGMYSCACVWDEFLSMISPSNRLIPLSFAVGNHDIGFNDGKSTHHSHALCDMKKPLHAKSLFFGWFAFQATTTAEGKLVPEPICMRSPVRVHSLQGVANFWILDSGYIMSPQEVADFVDDHFSQINFFGELNLGLYHVPLYPVSIEEYDHSEYLRASLGPKVFDKYNFSMNFENHVHMFKRTVPLRANQPAPPGKTGTIYLGDGHMGVDEHPPPDLVSTNSGIFAKVGTDFNYFILDLKHGGLANVTSLNQNGKIIDSFTYPYSMFFYSIPYRIHCINPQYVNHQSSYLPIHINLERLPGP